MNLRTCACSVSTVSVWESSPLTPQELHMLERIHDYFDVIDGVRWTRQAGSGT